MKYYLRYVKKTDDFQRYFIVDSKCLYDTIRTIHKSREYNQIQMVQRERDTFKSKDMYDLRRVHGKDNIADGLEKNNKIMQKQINEISVKCELVVP